MKKAFVGILAFLLAACSTTGSPNPAGPASTQTPLILPSATASPYSITETPTETVPATPGPVFAPTLIIPTLQVGYDTIPATIKMMDAQNGWGILLMPFGVLRPGIQTDPFLTRPEGYILRTTDGGNTWRNVTPPTGAYSTQGFFALDANTAWASDNIFCCNKVTATRLWHTKDGGKTWQASQPISFESGRFNEFYVPVQIQFVDQNTGWLLAAPEAGMDYSLRSNLYGTTDGGETWTYITELVNCWNGGLAFIDPTTGWYGTSCISGGKTMRPFNDQFSEGGWNVRQTSDGGTSFFFETLIPLPSDLQKRASTNPEVDCGERRVITFTSEAVGIEWECRVYSGLGIYKEVGYFSFTADLGQTWKTWEPTGNEYFINSTTGWRLLAPGQLQQTTDGGSSWTTIKVVEWENAQFDFIDKRQGWAIASNGDATALLHTADGGRTWAEINPVIAPQD